VSTALVGITEDFGGFSKASWVISAYLLGYVGEWQNTMHPEDGPCYHLPSMTSQLLIDNVPALVHI
jgi:hypothetical protein